MSDLKEMEEEMIVKKVEKIGKEKDCRLEERGNEQRRDREMEKDGMRKRRKRTEMRDSRDRKVKKYGRSRKRIIKRDKEKEGEGD